MLFCLALLNKSFRQILEVFFDTAHTYHMTYIYLHLNFCFFAIAYIQTAKFIVIRYINPNESGRKWPLPVHIYIYTY